MLQLHIQKWNWRENAQFDVTDFFFEFGKQHPQDAYIWGVVLNIVQIVGTSYEL